MKKCSGGFYGFESVYNRLNLGSCFINMRRNAPVADPEFCCGGIEQKFVQ